VKVKKVNDKGDPAKRAAAAAAAAAKKGVVAQPDGHVEGPDAHKVNVGGSTEETLKKLKVED
jgi:tyrosyl-tRNA synthetase